MKTAIITVIVLAALWLMLALFFGGIHIETGRGEHTGYITATAMHGLVWKKGVAYVKTDTQSSQEDEYCVTDTEVLAQLQQASLTKQHINVSFMSWLMPAAWECQGSMDIIYKVTALTE